jgi:EF-hand domain-containing protein 1
LEDDSIYIGEPKIENCGIPQGVFLKRHKIPRANGEGTYHWTDFNLGINIDIYSRVYRIYACDRFTCEFFESQNQELNPPESELEDNFLYSRMMLDIKQNPPDLAETKEYFEVKLKGGKPNKKLEQYIANDRKVL